MKANQYVIQTALFVWFLVLASVAGICQTQGERPHQYDINDLPFAVEKRRLDDAARALNADAAKIVYLVGFNKKGRNCRTATTRLRKSKKYLIEKHHISSDRIETVYGGTQDGLVMRIMIDERRSRSDEDGELVEPKFKFKCP